MRQGEGLIRRIAPRLTPFYLEDMSRFATALHASRGTVNLDRGAV